jgi:GLPGLI family protein
MNMQKQIAGTNFVIADSIPKIEWKITNENREIAGYNCRKGRENNGGCLCICFLHG